MKNRAKCKKCGSIIESLEMTDTVTCECGEITISGGAYKLIAFAKDFSNFLRVDEEGREIEVKYVEKDGRENNKREGHQKNDQECEAYTKITQPSKQELLEMLDALAKNIENLPPHAQLLPISHSDHYSLLWLLSEIFRAS